MLTYRRKRCKNKGSETKHYLFYFFLIIQEDKEKKYSEKDVFLHTKGGGD